MAVVEGAFSELCENFRKVRNFVDDCSGAPALIWTQATGHWTPRLGLGRGLKYLLDGVSPSTGSVSVGPMSDVCSGAVDCVLSLSGPLVGSITVFRVHTSAPDSNIQNPGREMGRF